MRLYDAALSTPIGIPKTSAGTFKSPRHYLPERESYKSSSIGTMTSTSYRLSCQRSAKEGHSQAKEDTSKYLFTGPSLGEIASTSTIDIGLPVESQQTPTSSYLSHSDVDQHCESGLIPNLAGDDETLSRCTSSTISSLGSIYAYQQISASYVAPTVSSVIGGYPNGQDETRWDVTSLTDDDAWWESSVISPASSPDWMIRYPSTKTPFIKNQMDPTFFVKDMRQVHETNVLFPVAKVTRTKRTDQESDRDQFCVNTVDGWEAFDHRSTTSDPSTCRIDMQTRSRGVPPIKSNEMDVQKHISPHSLYCVDTATTCDTSSNSSREGDKETRRAKADLDRCDSSTSHYNPQSRHVPVLLGHILEEKYQQIRRHHKKKEQDLTIDEAGFPVHTQRSQDSMLLVMKSDDDSCSIASKYIRSTQGEWEEVTGSPSYFQ